MVEKLFFSLSHQFVRKCRCTDSEICRIIGKRIIDLAVGNPVCHHDISCSMGFREHVFDPLTGPDIPFRHVMLQHIFFKLRPFLTFSFCNGSFTHTFHNREGFFTFNAFVDQISHDIITSTDCRGNGCLSFFNQGLCIVQPHICSMRQTGNTDQVRKRLWLGINYHLDNKICSKLRDSQAAKRTAVNILRCDSEHLCSCKKPHYTWIIQWNIGRFKYIIHSIVFVVHCIGIDQLFQRFDHGRIIMSKNIQFQKVVVDGMIIKMGGDNIGRHIICRMLDRGK